MRSGFATVGEFQQELEAREREKDDFIVSTKSARVSDNAIGFGDGWYDLMPTAHDQIAQWAGIPRRYYDKMGEIEGLRAHNVNQWLQRSDDRRMVRTLRNDARAFLSNKYMTIDNLQVMDAAPPAQKRHRGPGAAGRTIPGCCGLRLGVDGGQTRAFAAGVDRSVLGNYRKKVSKTIDKRHGEGV